MKRAAVEKPQIRTRWKRHYDDHVRQSPGKPVACVCDVQVGRFRKKHSFGCGQARCFLCHYDKLMGLPRHSDLKQLQRYREMHDAMHQSTKGESVVTQLDLAFDEC